MATRDSKSGLKAEAGHNFSTHGGGGDTIANGEILDVLGFESLVFILWTAAVGANTSVQILLEDSDTGSFSGEEEEVSDDFLIGTEADTFIDTANTITILGYVGKKQFVRASLNVLSGGNTIDTGILASFRNAIVQPVS